MSNIIPPLLSSTPPPINGSLDEEDDEFGDFTTAYNYDGVLSLTPSPQKVGKDDHLDINRNKSFQEKINACTNCDRNHLDVPNDLEEFNTDVDDTVTTTENFNSQRTGEPSVTDYNLDKSITTPNGKLDNSPSPELDDQFRQQNSSQLFVSENSEVLNFKNDSENFSKCGQMENPNSENNYETNEISNKLRTEEESKTSNDIQQSSVISNIESDSCTEKTIEEDEEFDDLTTFSSATKEEFGNTEESKTSDKEDGNSKDDEFVDFSQFSSSKDVLEQLEEDDFDDFATFSSEPRSDVKKSDDFNDFAVFSKTEVPSNNNKLENEVKIESNDDFTKFENFSKTVNLKENDDDDDDFGDFGDFTSTANEEKDEFGDFGQYSTNSNEAPISLILDSKDIYEKAKIIIEDNFPIINEDEEDCFLIDLKDNFVFNQLKDITESNALTFHWSKSKSQHAFLKALNIDMRNILYGPAWNNSMPKLGNLGAPLEPTKPEILTPIPATITSRSPSISSQKSGEIPSVQFDWNDSDLVNPLECSQTMLLDLEQLVTSLQFSSSDPMNHDPSSDLVPNDLDEWDLWLQSHNAKNLGRSEDPSQTIMDKIVQLSVKKTNSEELRTNEIVKDFTEFQANGIIPLRETHISTDPADFSTWLEPTIVTPELPRKVTLNDENEQEKDDDFDDFQMGLPEASDKEEVKAVTTIPNEINDDDEFTDFYSSLPSQTSLTLKPSNYSERFNFLEPSKVPIESSFVRTDPPKAVNSMELLQSTSTVPPLLKTESVIFDPLESPTVQSPIIISKPSFTPPEKSQLPKDEAFNLKPDPKVQQVSPTKPLEPLEKPKFEPMEILKPSFQPLQPTPLEPLKPTSSTPLSTQINWPDPGVTDDDIKHIELSYCRKSDEKTKTPTKNNSLDDEEWSDFVSVPHSTSTTTTERTSTPDLPLSVLNLNQVQPTKQPIPVITPNGLVQTKLSTNQPKIVQTTLQQNFYKSQPTIQQYQPSIISQTFTSTMQSNTNYNHQIPFSQQNFYKTQDQSLNYSLPKQSYHQSTILQNHLTLSSQTNNNDDDEWSDFISSQPLPQTQSNGFKSKTNIITNPQYETYVPQKKVQKQIPSISAMPDLDFIAPKSKTKK